MNFISMRELATQQKKMREKISKERCVITYNGRPIAVTTPVNEDNLVDEIIRYEAIRALRSLRKYAAKNLLSDEEINAEIDAYRKERAAKKRKKKKR